MNGSTSAADSWDAWGEPIPAEDEYVDATFGAGGYLARRWGPGYRPRAGQIELARAVDAAIRARTHLLSEAPTGCHAAGQLVLMHDGSLKRVEDVIVGDALTGPDGGPRRVLALARGRDRMVDIVPTDGERWRVNRGHVLTVAIRSRPDVGMFDVYLTRYMEAWTEADRRDHALVRRRPHGRGHRLERVDFSAVDARTVEPFFGFSLDGDGRFLLGDGTITHNTGKSLAYSVPASYHAAVSGRTVVLVTANIALQEQLCVGPDELILAANLRHVPAREVYEGMELVGFDEQRVGHRRRFRKAKVLAVSRSRKPCYRLHLSDGTSVVCSLVHSWLCARGNRIGWLQSDRMRMGSRKSSIIKLCDVWSEERSYEAGYLAAAVDGEGWFSQKQSKQYNGVTTKLGFSQNKNVMLDTVKDYLRKYGFRFKQKRHGRDHCARIELYNRPDVLSFLGLFRPKRLLALFDPDMLGTITSSRTVDVIEREFIGEHEVVSITTSTKTLIVNGLASHNCNKDLPMLQQVLPWSFSYGLMKGRGNYLCRSQYEKYQLGARQQPLLGDEASAPANERERLRLVAWADQEVAQGGYGDSSTLGWKPSDKLWREFSVAPEECKGNRCAFAGSCGALAAQRKARGSQLVVCNYHVLFTHLLIWMERGMDTVLPPFDLAVLDEAHKAADVAREFFGWRYSEGSVKRLARHVRGTDAELAKNLERAAGWFFTQMLQLRRDRDRYKARVVPDKLDEHDEASGRALIDRLGEFVARVDQELAPLEGATGEAGERASAAELARSRAVKLSVAVQSVVDGVEEDEVVFIEEDEFRTAHIACKLVRPGGVLAHALFGKTVRRPAQDGAEEPSEEWPVSVVATSATLATESGFGFAKSELGVGACRELVVGSPFDYPSQALLILPDVCDPNDPRFTAECAAILQRTIVLARGRTLGLFTSRKRMNEVFDLIVGQTPYRILRQDDGQRTQLVEEFRRDVHSVLLGVSSFWAGVDVPGESLSVVFIDKIPFPPPDDPVVERLTETDKRAWAAYAVPRAIIEFKQGFGRLIRSDTDRGVVVCCDARLTKKGYGKQFLRAMPKGMQKIRNLEALREWLDGAVAPPPPEEVDPLS